MIHSLQQPREHIHDEELMSMCMRSQKLKEVTQGQQVGVQGQTQHTGFTCEGGNRADCLCTSLCWCRICFDSGIQQHEAFGDKPPQIYHMVAGAMAIDTQHGKYF